MGDSGDGEAATGGSAAAVVPALPAIPEQDTWSREQVMEVMAKKGIDATPAELRVLLANKRFRPALRGGIGGD